VFFRPLVLSFRPMPTPEQQKEYTRLAGLLMAVGQRHRSELPRDAISLALWVNDGKVRVEVYDSGGKIIGTIPNSTTSSAFRSDLERLFAHETLPDENIISFV